MILKYKTNYSQIMEKEMPQSDIAIVASVNEVNPNNREVVTDMWHYVSFSECSTYYDVNHGCLIVSYRGKDNSLINQCIYDEAYLINDNGQTIEVLHR